MKKFFLGVLTALVGVSCFATACSSNKNSSDNSENKEALADAAKSLKSTYGETIEDLDGRTDFEVSNTWNYGGVTYTVTWAASSATEGEECPLTLTVEDDVTFVDVNKLLSTETQYYLTATLTAPNGNTEEAKILGKVDPIDQMVSAKISGDPVVNTEYVLALYQANHQKTLYLNGNMSSYYFATSEMVEQAKSILVEENAATTDVANDFFMYFLDGETKTYLNVVPRDGSTTKVNVTFNPEPLSSWIYNADIGTMSTTTNEKIWFLGTFGTNYTISACESPKYDSNFKACLTTVMDRANVDDAVKVSDTLNSLSFDAVIAGVHTENLARTGDVYPEATITWSLAEGTTAAALNKKGNKLTSIAVTEPAEVTLTATVQSGEVKESKSFTFKVIPNETSAILTAAKSLNSGDSFVNEVTLTGVITSFKDVYSTDYENVSPYFTVGENSLLAYRMKGNGADKIDVNDEITVTGILTNYNGSIQFSSGCALDSWVSHSDEPADSSSDESADSSSSVPADDSSSSVPEDSSSSSTDGEMTPAEIVDKAYELAAGESLDGTYTLTGVIISLDNYTNPTIVVANKTDKPMYCYRLASSEFAVGDTITVTGAIKNYNGTIEMMNCTLVEHIKGEGGNDDSSSSVPADDSSSSVPADDSSSSVPEDSSSSITDGEMTQAEIVDAAYALAENASLDGTYELTGTISSVDTAYSSQYKNITVTIKVEGKEDKPIKCFRLAGGETLKKGDVITVTGTLINYQGTIEFDKGCTYVLVSSAPETPETPEEPVDGLQLSLDDKANRTELSDSKQVWEQNGVKLTNEKTSSSNAIADFVPARFYKNSSLTIECTGMKKIVFNCNDYKNTYATDLQASITGANATVTVDGLVVTVEFATAVDSFTIASLAGQVRVNSLVVVTE